MCKWNALALLVAGAVWQVGCAEPAPKPMTAPPPKPAASGQSGSTTGGGAEVPLPATKATEEPKTETPPAEATPAEPAPADAKPADPAAASPGEGEKKPE